MTTDETAEKIEEPVVEQPVEEVVPEPEPEPEVVGPKDSDPLTGEEIKQRATELQGRAMKTVGEMATAAKNLWLNPVRREVRGAFNKAQNFLGDLRNEDQSK